MNREALKLEDELDVLQRLFRDEQSYRKLLEQKGALAQSLLDWLQQLVNVPEIPDKLRASICKTMIRLSKNSDLHPTCQLIRGVTIVGKHPVAFGGFGDVYKGEVGVDGSLVCLKVPRVSLSDVKRFLEPFLREAIVWRQLKHPNILPCFGMYYLDDTHERVCLASPWMENGTLSQYLSNRLPESVDCLQLMHDIASGLAHLHELKVVHGDLKGANILITPGYRACITDFGLSTVADSQIHKITSTSSAGKPNTARWSAPEVLMEKPVSRESDIYSCGGVFYEIVTGNIPFYEIKRDEAVIGAITFHKKHPSRSANMKEEFWSVMTHCWEWEAKSRPTAKDLVQRLTADRTITLPEDWGAHLFTELQGSVPSSSLSPEAIEFLTETLGADVIEREKWTSKQGYTPGHTDNSSEVNPPGSSKQSEDRAAALLNSPPDSTALAPEKDEGEESEQELLDTPRIAALELEKLEVEKDLKDRETDIDQMRTSIDDLQAELDEKASELAEKEKSLADLESQLTSKAAADYQRNRAWLEAKYKDVKAQVNEEHRRVQSKEELLQILWQKLQNQQKALREQAARQNALQEQIQQREALLAARERQLVAQEVSGLLGTFKVEDGYRQGLNQRQPMIRLRTVARGQAITRDSQVSSETASNQVSSRASANKQSGQRSKNGPVATRALTSETRGENRLETNRQHP